MERFKRLSKNRILLTCFSIFTVVGVVCACVLPSSAITIDGDEYELVTISQQDIINMVNAGDLTVSFSYYADTNSPGLYGNFFIMNNGLTLNPSTSSGSPFIIPQSDFNVTAVGSDQIMIYAPYAFSVQNTQNGLDLIFDFQVSLPFSGYVDSQQYKFWFFASGLADGTTQLLGKLGNSSQFSQTSSFTFGSSSTSVYWKDVPALQTFYSVYNRVPQTVTYQSIQTYMKYSALTTSYSGHKEIDSLSFSLSYSTMNISGTPERWAPIAFVLQTGFQMYMTPSQADDVNTYLGLIASDTPTAQQQSELNELRSKFSEKKESMQEWVDDLHVEVPDRPGLDDLPTVEVDGVEVPVVNVVNEVSQTVVAPLFNYSIVTILVGSVLGISFIKILLFGSGEA